MNEKIRKLAEQAEKYANEQAHRAWHHSSGFNPFKEKFAELIIRECLDHIDTMERIAHASNASIPDDHDEYTYLQTLNVLKSLIKSQFEIE